MGNGAAEPPAQVLKPRADQIDNFRAERPDQAGRRLTPCRSQKPSLRA